MKKKYFKGVMLPHQILRPHAVFCTKVLASGAVSQTPRLQSSLTPHPPWCGFLPNNKKCPSDAPVPSMVLQICRESYGSDHLVLECQIPHVAWMLNDRSLPHLLNSHAAAGIPIITDVSKMLQNTEMTGNVTTWGPPISIDIVCPYPSFERLKP